MSFRTVERERGGQRAFPQYRWKVSIKLSVRRLRPPIVFPSANFLPFNSFFFLLNLPPILFWICPKQSTFRTTKFHCCSPWKPLVGGTILLQMSAFLPFMASLCKNGVLRLQKNVFIVVGLLQIARLVFSVIEYNHPCKLRKSNQVKHKQGMTECGKQKDGWDQEIVK